MKKNSFLVLGACAAAMFTAANANAQEAVVVEEQTVVDLEVPCKTYYNTQSNQNWFIQAGAGIAVPFVENNLYKEDGDRHITANYNLGFGRWFSPYMAWRLGFQGGALHWDTYSYSKSKYVTANLDFMWDMFNSLGGVNSKRVFSVVPFVGLGGTFAWDYQGKGQNVLNRHEEIKRNQWLLPVSAGAQLRFRLCSSVDFFAEARAQFYSDAFNNYVGGRPVDINLTGIGGFTVYFGGRNFESYNPCDYVGYINNLNNQVNDLRGALAATSAALAAAEAQLPCPEVVETEAAVVDVNPLMATVRFKINSDRISDEEMVNVYNIAQWMKTFPGQNVTIAGYADKKTGTSDYNMGLSKRRAEAVRKALVDKYGVNPDRLSISAQGSAQQPYDVNNWNRIVIFSAQ